MEETISVAMLLTSVLDAIVATEEDDEDAALLDGGGGELLDGGGGGGGGAALLAGAGAGVGGDWAASAVDCGTLTVIPAFAQKSVENLSTAKQPGYQFTCLWRSWTSMPKSALTNLIILAAIFHHVIREGSLEIGILAHTCWLVETAASCRKSCLGRGLL